MALKDLKSDLSKFRMPKKDPLVNKKVESVNKKVNQNPLSSLIKSMSDIPKPNTNPTKRGTTPSKFDNASNFLGETDPNKMDNESKFLGETNPTKFDNESNFLGETDPNKMDNESKFLGETKPSDFNNESKFLGETDPNKMDNESKFLGETLISSFDNSSNFLGETDPNKMDNSSNFLGETDVSNFNNSSNFLGETTPSNFNFEPSHEKTAKTPSEVNYLSDIHASGFTSKFENKDDTKFIGINPNNTIFDSTNSKFSNFQNSFPGISFTPGYGSFKLNSSSTPDTQRYNPDRKYYIDTNLTNDGISQLQDLNGSPSFLENAYNKFNLKDDSFNTTIPFLNHPLILRGIQKKNGNPEDYGQFGLSFDDGFIRGGTISSTTRALVDTARIGSWLLSPKGQLWGIKQVGMQRLNKSNKIWTPANLLTAVGSQHLGLKPNRSGLLPFNTPLKREGGAGEKLENIYTIETAILTSYQFNTILPTQTDLFGGFDSFYGIGITTTTRYTNTFKNFAKVANHYKSGFLLDSGLTKQTINPVLYKTDVNTGYSPVKTAPVSKLESKPFVSVPTDDDEKKLFGLAGKLLHNENSIGVVPEVVQNKEKSNSEIDILKYETTVYGLSNQVSRRDAGGFSDFRKLLSSDNKHNKLTDNVNYETDNYITEKNFGTTVGTPIANLNERDEWDLTKFDGGRHDNINASNIGDGEQEDFVNLWFKPFKTQFDTKSVQFRGIVSGISETFSPNWEPIKYNGRADSAYKYSSFSRSLTFSFKVIATSKLEMIPIWKKLQFLSTMTMPSDYSSTGYSGTLIKFRLGSLWNNELAFISSLGYTISDDVSWDIDLKEDKTFEQIPRAIDISITLQLLPNNGDNSLPHLGSKVYSCDLITSVGDGENITTFTPEQKAEIDDIQSAAGGSIPGIGIIQT